MTESLVTTYNVTGLSPKTNYIFEIRAANIYGYGLYSNSTTIKTLAVPDQMSPVTTSNIVNNIAVTWSYPNDNLAPVDFYDVQILDPITNVYTSDTSYCNGSDPTIIANRVCTIPLTYLRSQYQYALFDLVEIKIRAHNIIGYG